MSNLNIIDALIISTGVNIILNPLIKSLLKRLSSSNNFKNVPKPKPKSKLFELPDDVITLILSKLDIITLRTCTTALSLDAFLPNIASLATQLPESLFVHDRYKYRYNRCFNNILSKSWPRLKQNAPNNCRYAPLYSALRAVNFTLTLSDDLWWFIRKLSGLKLLEVEVPAFPCEISKVRPNLWYKWEGKIGVHGVVDHFVHVFGDTVDDDTISAHEEVISRGYKISERIRSVHSSVVYLGKEGKYSWKTGLTLRTKDVGGTGCLEIGPYPCFNTAREVTEIFHLSSTTMFSKDGCQVQDVILMIQLICRKQYTDDVDVVKAYFDEANQTTTTMTELKQVAKQILADETCRLLQSIYLR